ncbi:hypothetical protein LCGC14_1097380 [marine sediment metagenome]|uniref:Uncharacterized protein n=1 Tax=marine sediment metagenome TaxID=412755 RepID=A0A0F9MAM4_9ZZZZ
MTVNEALTEAFSTSQYLHSVGSGDEQAIQDLRVVVGGLDSDEENVALLAGALMARAMTTDIGVVGPIAEELYESWVEEYSA